MKPLRPRNERLLRDLEPFVVATSESLALLDPAPFGLAIPPSSRLDPLRASSAPFLERLVRLDALTFGPAGMPMPRWLFLNAAELPSAIVGFAWKSEALDAEARALFRIGDGEPGLVPCSMYIAVPSMEPWAWVGHNLASATALLPRHGLTGLGSLTKAVALATYRAFEQIGATQWASPALHVHAKLGPLLLLSAWTPAHGDPATLTYSARVDEASLRHLAGDPSGHVTYPAPERWIDSADHGAMMLLQAQIEMGERFCIAGPPEPMFAGRQRVPLARAPI